jgi:hypothetical protein
MDIELLLHIASQRVERNDVVSVAVEANFEESNDEENGNDAHEKPTSRRTRQSSMRSTLSFSNSKTCTTCMRSLSSRKANAAVIECSYHECENAFHLECLGMTENDRPSPWFCQACLEPSLKQSQEGLGIRHNKPNKKLEREQRQQQQEKEEENDEEEEKEEDEEEDDEGNIARPAHKSKQLANRSSSGTKRAATERKLAGSESTVAKKARRSIRPTNEKQGNARNVAKPTESKQARQPPHQSTIHDLVDVGFLKPGDKIEVPYLNKYRFVGKILPNGCIGFEGHEFHTPPSFALYCKRKIYKDKQSDRGWTSCFHGDTPLLAYRDRLGTPIEPRPRRYGFTSSSKSKL